MVMIMFHYNLQYHYSNGTILLLFIILLQYYYHNEHKYEPVKLRVSMVADTRLDTTDHTLHPTTRHQVQFLL